MKLSTTCAAILLSITTQQTIPIIVVAAEASITTPTTTTTTTNTNNQNEQHVNSITVTHAQQHRMTRTTRTTSTTHRILQDEEMMNNWIKDNGYNKYGDPMGTSYIGGSPLFDEQTGTLYDYNEYMEQKFPDMPWLGEMELMPMPIEHEHEHENEKEIVAFETEEHHDYDWIEKEKMLLLERETIDTWLISNELNAYGDEEGTLYPGSSPLFDMTTGETMDRVEYIKEKFPDSPWEVDDKEEEMLLLEQETIDAWLVSNQLNAYGDKEGTIYNGSSPLFDMTTGETMDRVEYIKEKFPDSPWEVEYPLENEEGEFDDDGGDDGDDDAEEEEEEEEEGDEDDDADEDMACQPRSIFSYGLCKSCDPTRPSSLCLNKCVCKEMPEKTTTVGGCPSKDPTKFVGFCSKNCKAGTTDKKCKNRCNCAADSVQVLVSVEGCEDTKTKFDIMTSTGETVRRNGCTWAAQMNTSYRCLKEEIRKMCPHTCRKRCKCHDSKEKFQFINMKGEKSKQDCDWAKARNTEERCKIKKVAAKCKGVCNPACNEVEGVTSPSGDIIPILQVEPPVSKIDGTPVYDENP